MRLVSSSHFPSVNGNARTFVDCSISYDFGFDFILQLLLFAMVEAEENNNINSPHRVKTGSGDNKEDGERI